jgi:hypothetical protein
MWVYLSDNFTVRSVQADDAPQSTSYRTNDETFGIITVLRQPCVMHNHKKGVEKISNKCLSNTDEMYQKTVQQWNWTLKIHKQKALKVSAHHWLFWQRHSINVPVCYASSCCISSDLLPFTEKHRIYLKIQKPTAASQMNIPFPCSTVRIVCLLVVLATVLWRWLG